MKRYTLDYNGKEMEVTESAEAFNSQDGTFFDLPNDTEIFITKNCVAAMHESLALLNTVYEGGDIADVFPSAEEKESSVDSSGSFEKDGR